MTSPILTTTALDIIQGALRLIGETDANQSPGDDQVIDGLQSLNFMVKGWQSQGLHLWTKTEGILFLQAGKTDYNLGPNGDETGLLDDFIDTTISTAALAAARTLALTSTTGMNGSDDIFVSDPSESLQGWTIVSGTLALSNSSLEVSNAAFMSGEVTRTLSDLTVGRFYRLNVTVDLTSSPSVVYSVLDGTTVLATQTITADGTAQLEFTATQTSHTFKIKNGDTAGTNSTLTTAMILLDTSTGDLIGTELDDGSRQWTTIIEFPTSTTVDIVDALTSAAAVNNIVFSVPELIDRPLRILQLRRDDISATTSDSTTEIEAVQWSRQQYFAQPDKTSQGTINNWYYSPQLTDGRLYVWQTANNVNQVAKFTFERPIEITQETSEQPNFPSEWFRTLKYNLAVEIAPEYRTPIDRLQLLKFDAASFLDASLGYDREDSSLNIQPDFRGR